MAHPALAIFRRRLFTFMAILSLALCLATVALWVRSYWRYDWLVHVSGRPDWIREFRMFSSGDELVFLGGHHNSRYTFGPTLAPGLTALTAGFFPEERFRDWVNNLRQDRTFWCVGFGYIEGKHAPAYSVRAVCFPLWFLAMIFALLPAVRLRTILRTRRQNRAGLCQHCGYDLRATPDRCPECGHVPLHLNAPDRP